MKLDKRQVSTGWEALEHKLLGGLSGRELNIIAGASGVGKSLFFARPCQKNKTRTALTK